MTWIETFFEFFILLSSMIAFLAGVYQFTNFKSPIARWSGFVLLGISLNSACYYFLKMAVFPEAGRFLVFFEWSATCCSISAI